MKILVDLDGVCADLLSVWLERYNKDHGENLTVSDITTFYISECVKPEHANLIKNYLNEPGLFRRLPIYPNCYTALRTLQDIGHELFIVTNTPYSSVTGFHDKWQWVSDNLPFIPRDNFFSTALKHMVRGDLLVDDYCRNINHFPGKTCVIDYPYNQGARATWRVSDWKEFIEKVIPELPDAA